MRKKETRKDGRKEKRQWRRKESCRIRFSVFYSPSICLVRVSMWHSDHSVRPRAAKSTTSFLYEHSSFIPVSILRKGHLVDWQCNRTGKHSIQLLYRKQQTHRDQVSVQGRSGTFRDIQGHSGTFRVYKANKGEKLVTKNKAKKT